MSRLQNMRVIRIEPFRAVSSGEKRFDELFGDGGFCQWVDAHGDLLLRHPYEPVDFLWHVGAPETWGHGLNVWIHALRDGVTDVGPYEIIEFPGGIYLAATADESDPEDLNETVCGMMKWIENSEVFDCGDFPQSGMCNMPNPDGEVDRAMGIAQQQIFLPLKYKRVNTDE